MTIVGTRPELIKLSRVIAELDCHLQHILVHSGQNFDYELNQIFFDELEIRKPDYFLNIAAKTAAESISLVIMRADVLLAKEKPDAVLFYGDTNTCLAVIAAKRRKIPVFHMEAGNRCFDERVPEETNRRIIDHLSDINMPLTEHARRYLLREGIAPETIIKTGSCMQEVLAYYAKKIAASDILARLNLQHEGFFVVSAHREENVDSEQNLHDLLDALQGIAEKYNKPVIISTHPRTRQRLDALQYDNNQNNKNNNQLHPLIHFMKPLGFLDYIHLQQHAFCVISDSGTISEEASLLNLPAIIIRQAHERPEAMDAGILIMSGLKRQRILQSIAMIRKQFNTAKTTITPVVADYEAGLVSVQVARIIMSYTDYVRRTVWRQN